MPQQLVPQECTTIPSFLLIEMGLNNFLLGLASNHDPPVSASPVAGIIGMSHYAWLQPYFLFKNI
jgi:hypothetical protein